MRGKDERGRMRGKDDRGSQVKRGKENGTEGMIYKRKRKRDEMKVKLSLIRLEKNLVG